MPQEAANNARLARDEPPAVTRIALRGRRMSRRSGARRIASSSGAAASALDTAAFDTACVLPAFVAGPENRLLSQVIEALVGSQEAGRSSKPFAATNRPHGPITLVGATGSGKTHLAHGLAELWHQSFGAETPPAANKRQQVAVYLTASDFSRQLADAIDEGSVNEFRRQLRACGLLVIDDLDRTSASSHVQEELLHTIDSLTDAGSLVVFTAATLPAETSTLGRPLVSRLASGLVLEIAPLGVEARVELLRDIGASLGCRVNEDALTTLAGRLPGEPPRLLGAGIELRLRFGSLINAADAERFLNDADRAGSPPLRDIFAAAARYYGVTQKMLTSSRRHQTVVLARAVAIYLARKLTPLTYQEIGQSLGGRDHTTVLHNYRRVEIALPKDRALRSAVDELRRSIEQPSL